MNSLFRSLLQKVFAALCFTIVVIVGTDQASADNGLVLDCNQVATEASSLLECDYRAKQPVQPEELNLSINGEPIDKPAFTPFLTGQKKSAWLFLIDRSNPRRKETVLRNVDIVKTQLRNASLRRLMGVATFASDLELVLEPAAAHDNLDARLDEISANGMATEYFANTLAAIKILKKVEADRKALVIMSDGKAEDTAYERSDVVNAAQDAGVTIVGIGFAEKETETPSLQKVRRLAEETNGLFTSVIGAQPISSRFLTDLARSIENGGIVTANLPSDMAGPAEVELSIRSGDGSLYTASLSLELVAADIAVPTEETPPLSLVGKIYSVFSFDAGMWADSNPVLAWLALVALPFLIAGYLLFANRAQDKTEYQAETVDELITGVREPVSGVCDVDQSTTTDQTHIVTDQDSNQMFGHFEVVGNEDMQYDIRLQSVSIGRHSDNDIQLTNDTVHRHHAHFFINPEGEATIKDLDTTNGLIVSGQRVSSATLMSGDVVELGEVRLRYQSV